jgi:hypothetical protein
MNGRISVRTQYNISEWIMLSLWVLGLIIFTSRPFTFLSKGTISNIVPYDIFLWVNFLYLTYNYIIIYIPSLYIINQYKENFLKTLYIIICSIGYCLALILLVLLVVYSSNCNGKDYPGNPCNSEYYCCKFGSALRECNVDLSVSPNCAVSIYTLANLQANSTFVEYFVWVVFFIIIKSVVLYLNILHMEELNFNDQHDEEINTGNIGIGMKFGLKNQNNYNESKLKHNFIIKPQSQINIPDLHDMVHNFFKFSLNKITDKFKSLTQKYKQSTIYRKYL